MQYHKRITRRQAILSLTAAAAGALIRPTSVFAATPAKDKLRFAVIGDWGTGCEDQAGICQIMTETHRKGTFDFVLAAGDNIYPNGDGKHFLKKFERPFANLLNDRVPFYAVLGNHDVESGRQDQMQYALFNMNSQRYYTVSKGDGLADFFLLDTTDFDREQLGWLEGALQQSTARWKIAMFHHPIYSSGKKHGTNLKLREAIEPVLVRHKVNAVFSGHDHIYERTHPQQGIQYFVTGAGGKTRRGGVDLKSPIRAASFDQDNHFMLVEIDDREINFKAVAETGEVVDTGSIK